MEKTVVAFGSFILKQGNGVSDVNAEKRILIYDNYFITSRKLLAL